MDKLNKYQVIPTDRQDKLCIRIIDGILNGIEYSIDVKTINVDDEGLVEFDVDFPDDETLAAVGKKLLTEEIRFHFTALMEKFVKDAEAHDALENQI